MPRCAPSASSAPKTTVVDVRAGAAVEPALALDRLSAAGTLAERERVARSLDPAQWADATFVDRAMERWPGAFRFAAPDLRADPARARRAILAHPANVDAARIDAETLHDILRAIPWRPPNTRARDAWHEDPVPHHLRAYGGVEDLELVDDAVLAVARAPARLAELPPERLLDLRFLERLVAADPSAVAAWPLDRLDPRTRERLTGALVELALRHPEWVRHLPSELRGRPWLFHELVERAPGVMVHALGAAREIEYLWRQAIGRDVRLLTDCPPELFDPQHAVSAAIDQLRARTLTPAEVPSAIAGDHHLGYVAITSFGGVALERFHLWLDLPTHQGWIDGVFRMHPEHFANGLRSLPPAVVRQLERIGVGEATRRFALALLEERPELYAGLPAALRDDPEVRQRAFELDPPADAILSADPETRRRIVHRRPEALFALPAPERTRELALAAVTLDGALLGRLSEAQRDDAELVLAAVTNCGDALVFASERRRADPEIARTAVRASPDAYAHHLVPEALRWPVDLELLRRGRVPDLTPYLDDPDKWLAIAASPNGAASDYVAERIRERGPPYDHATIDALVELAPRILRKLPPEVVTARHYAIAARGLEPPYVGDALARRDELPAEFWEHAAIGSPGQYLLSGTAARAGLDPALLKRAGVAAIAASTRNLEHVPAEWWQDDAFVASAVRANPLVLERLGEPRKLWLRHLRPGDVAYAEERLRRLAASGFTRSRFEHDPRLLFELLDNRFASGPADPRPVAVVVYPKHDHNDAFATAHFGGLTKRHRVMYYEAGTDLELAEAVRAGTRWRPAEVLILAAHGQPRSLTLGASDQPAARARLRPGSTRALGEHVPAERLAPGAKVVFDACSVGRGGAFGRNLVNDLQLIWPSAWVQAAWRDSSSANRLVFDAEGRFERIDFVDSNRRQVPSYVAPPVHRRR